MDYEFLKEEGIRLVQQLSGDIWTDYNAHDPGVTILEQLCYAITELGYRTNFPIKEILSNKSQNNRKIDDNAFFPPNEILPGAPWSINDYRKILIDQIEINFTNEDGISRLVRPLTNVWIQPQLKSNIQGFFRILVQIDDNYLEAKAEIKKEVENFIFRNRNVGEDLLEVIILNEYLLTLEADIDLKPDAIPETVLAHILFELELAISPRIIRQSWQDLLGEGYSMDQIFEGPLPNYGFAKDSQLKSLSKVVFRAKIEKAIMKVKGVHRIRTLTVYKKNILTTDDVISIDDEDTFPLMGIGDLKKAFTDAKKNDGSHVLRPITFFQNKDKVDVDISQADHILSGLWDNLESSYPTSFNEYDEDYFLGKEPKAIDEFTSINEHFPEIYGISKRGLASTESINRRIKTKQLKAYLLLFDQLIADYLSQLNHVRQLFSVKSDIKHSYFSRPPIAIDIDHLDNKEILKTKLRFDPANWKKLRNSLKKLNEKVLESDHKNEISTRFGLSFEETVAKWYEYEYQEEVRQKVMKLSNQEILHLLDEVSNDLVKRFEKLRKKYVLSTLEHRIQDEFIPNLKKEPQSSESKFSIEQLVTPIGEKIISYLKLFDSNDWKSLCQSILAANSLSKDLHDEILRIIESILSDFIFKVEDKILEKLRVNLRILVKDVIRKEVVEFILEFYFDKKIEDRVLAQVNQTLSELPRNGKRWKRLFVESPKRPNAKTQETAREIRAEFENYINKEINIVKEGINKVKGFNKRQEKIILWVKKNYINQRNLKSILKIIVREHESIIIDETLTRLEVVIKSAIKNANKVFEKKKKEDKKSIRELTDSQKQKAAEKIVTTTIKEFKHKLIEEELTEKRAQITKDLAILGKYIIEEVKKEEIEKLVESGGEKVSLNLENREIVEILIEKFDKEDWATELKSRIENISQKSQEENDKNIFDGYLRKIKKGSNEIKEIISDINKIFKDIDSEIHNQKDLRENLRKSTIEGIIEKIITISIKILVEIKDDDLADKLIGKIEDLKNNWLSEEKENQKKKRRETTLITIIRGWYKGISGYNIFRELLRLVHGKIVDEQVAVPIKKLKNSEKLDLLRNRFSKIPRPGLMIERLSQNEIKTIIELKEFLNKDPFAFWNEVQSLVYQKDSFLKRRHKFVDHLLARMGEKFLSDPISSLENSLNDSNYESVDQQLLNLKLTFLNQIVGLTKNKAKGFDYTKEVTEENNTYLYSKISLSLGIPNKLTHRIYQVVEDSPLKFENNRPEKEKSPEVENSDLLTEILTSGNDIEKFKINTTNSDQKVCFYSNKLNRNLELYSKSEHEKWIERQEDEEKRKIAEEIQHFIEKNTKPRDSELPLKEEIIHSFTKLREFVSDLSGKEIKEIRASLQDLKRTLENDDSSNAQEETARRLRLQQLTKLDKSIRSQEIRLSKIHKANPEGFRENLVKHIRYIQKQTESFYLVENILLCPVREPRHNYTFDVGSVKILKSKKLYEGDHMNAFTMDLINYVNTGLFEVKELNEEEMADCKKIRKISDDNEVDEKQNDEQSDIQNKKYRLIITDSDGEEFARSLECYESTQKVEDDIILKLEEFEESLIGGSGNTNTSIGKLFEEKLIPAEDEEKDKKIREFLSFQISLIFPSWCPRFSSKEFSIALEEILLQNVPAHLATQVYKFDIKKMEDFERIYHDWLDLRKEYVEKKQLYDIALDDLNQKEKDDRDYVTDQDSVRRLSIKVDDIISALDEKAKELVLDVLLENS